MKMQTRIWQLINGSGLSHACSLAMAGRLQILCYHGYSFEDEHLFRGQLFMQPEIFERRLAWLRKHRYAVLDLGEAIDRLNRGKIRSKEIVITIDDGFHSVFALGAPLLATYGMRATVYVTTYYVSNPIPVFRLAIQYLAWKSGRASASLDGLVEGQYGTLDLHDGRATDERLLEICEVAETQCTEDGRTAIAREFGRRVDVDYDDLLRDRRLSLMSPDEIGALARMGLDVQLHTHRHRLPLAPHEIVREIEANRKALAPHATRELRHLCYPSGVWDVSQWETLSTLGIETATTCLPGPNSRNTPRLALRRFLDEQNLAPDEFAAEIRGCKHLARAIRDRAFA